MPAATTPEPQGTCFVVMGFGKKTDFETGRVLDLDQSYEYLIKPAVEAAGLKCIRADEIVHSGLIDVPMYELLLKADIVVADLSTSNRNAIYELGVRHALRPYTTVVIAEEQIMKSPFFDLNHIVIRQYRHMGNDIPASEARRFTGELTSAIKQIMATEPKLRWDSPVYKFIDKLTPPSIEEAQNAATAAVAAAASPGPTADAGIVTAAHSQMMQRVEEAQTKGDWLRAKMLLEEIRAMRKTKDSQAPANQQIDKSEDPYILQRLALATYKSKYPSPAEALKAAAELLALLEPQTCNDTETLGMWGSVHKQLWALTKDRTDLDEAVRAHERGFYLRNDYYNGINYAFLLNVRAANTADAAEAIADFVQARRVRKEVLEICDRWLKANPAPADAVASAKLGAKYSQSRYWVLATVAEAYFGLGDEVQGEQRLAEAFAAAPEEWMKKSTTEQLDKLKPLLADSPLTHLQPAAPAG